MIRRRTITSYEWHVATGNETVVLLDCVKSFFRRLELLGGTEQLTTTGKNLLNSNIYAQGYLASVDTGQKISLNTEAKSFTTSMDVSSMVGKNISISVRTKETSGKKYAFTDETDVIISGKFDAGRNVYSKYNNIQIPQNAKKLYFSVTYDVQENTELQVELGANSTPYEPYTGLKPSPSPEYPQEIKNVGKWNEEKQKYEVDIKVTGKNLLDIKDITSETPQWLEIPCLIKNNIYIKSNNSTVLVENNQARLIVCFKDGTSRAMYDNSMADGVPFKANSENPITTIKVRGTHIKSGAHSDIQVEYGNAPTPYEPYTEQPLTLTSDRPITKWDKLVEQDGQYGWLYGSKIYVVTGNEVFESRDGYNIESYTNRFFILNDLLKENDVLKPLAYMKCLRNVQYVYSPNIFEEGFKTNINQFHIKLSNDRVGILASDDHAVRTAKFSGYMKKIHKNGNPIEILYATTESQFVPISEFEQTQLRNLHSENGTTHVFVDSGEVPCGINVEYKTKS